MKRLFSARIRDFLRTAKNGGMASAWGYLWSARVHASLAPLARSFPLEPVEVHILTGSSRLTMALWMIASWILTTERSWKFVIHDDGTFLSGEADQLAKLLPNCRVILHTESTRQIMQLLDAYPLCLKCRNLHPLSKKLFDFPLLAAGDRFFSIDSDVLFFKKPGRLIQWCAEAKPGLIFMEDVKDASLLSEDEVQQLFNRPLIHKVNTGIIAMPKAALSLEAMECCLAKTRLLNSDPWYVEQTLYALLGSIYGHAELLPKEYVMSLDPVCPSNAFARHYVGAVRQYFYSEGIPWVVKNLQRQKRASAINN